MEFSANVEMKPLQTPLNSSDSSITQKVVRNTLWNIVGRFWSTLVMIVLTPYIIKHIGIERYGIWTIVGIFTGYLGFLDLGLNNSFIKYISEFYTRKEFEKIYKVINTGFAFYLITSAFIIVLGLMALTPILGFLNISGKLVEEVRLVLLLAILQLGTSLPATCLNSIPWGLQRMEIANKAAIGISWFYLVGTIFFLELGYGLIGLVINGLIINIISFVIHLKITNRLLPQFKLNPFQATRPMFYQLFDFGIKIQFAKICSTITLTIDKLLISRILSIGLVTFYELGSYITHKVRGSCLILLPALGPAFSEIATRGEKEKLLEGYLRSTKYLALIALPLFSFIIISAPQIMLVWMGKGYEASIRIIQILALGHITDVLLTNMVDQLWFGIGRASMMMWNRIINMLATVSLTMLLISQFGFMGAAIGTTVAIITTSVYYLIKTYQILQVPLGKFIKYTFLKPLLTCLLIGLVLWGLSSIVFYNFELNRLSGVITLVLQAVLFFGLCFIILSYLKPLDDLDLRILSKGRPLFIQRLLKLFAVNQ